MIDEQLVRYLESYLTPRRKARFEEVLANRTNYISVAVEDVYHMHNTSAVMRSCDVFGIQKLHAIDEVNQKRIDREIALGAQKWVDVVRHNTTKEFIKSIKSKGYQLVATTPHKPAVSLNDFIVDTPTVFCFGKETEGLSDIIFEAADVHVNIPMVGFTESLNISVSAAILLQQVTNRLRNSELPWQLTEEEKLQKRFDWCTKTIKNSSQIIDRFMNQKAM